MSLSRVSTFAEQNPQAFYWRLVLPVQSMLLSVFAAPMYGFSALIAPINTTFSAEHTVSGWPGPMAGGLILLGGGFGALMNGRLIKVAGQPGRLLIALNVLVLIVFGLGALASKLQSIWLLILGFALPTGLVFSNLYSLCVLLVMGWAKRFNRTGLQSGVVGLGFGLWAAFYSFFGPMINKSIGLEWLLLGTGASIMLIGFIASCFFVEAPAKQPTAVKTEVSASENTPVELKTTDLFKLAPYWLFSLFFMLFLMPGFGFKIIVQVLSTEVFHVDAKVAAIIAVAFLTSYGLATLITGIVSDKLSVKRLYIIFAAGQAISLFVAAFTLPSINSVLLFSILMCLTGTMFAAGKCIWLVTLTKLYGAQNLNTVVHATLPAYGLAGLLGPISLNFALQKTDIVTATSGCLYIMASALLICVVLIMMIRRVDYRRFASGKKQEIHFNFRARDDLDRY